jgi:hypothetical protein
MIRPATLHDVDAIFEIAMNETVRYPLLQPDRAKIRKGIVRSISAAKHFAWVSESRAGIVKGALIGLTSDNLWAQRQNCLVTLWISEIVGDGARLLRAFKMWVQSRRVIRIAGFVIDTNHIDRRAWKLAEHIGFKRYGGTYLMYN